MSFVNHSLLWNYLQEYRELNLISILLIANVENQPLIVVIEEVLFT